MIPPQLLLLLLQRVGAVSTVELLQPEVDWTLRRRRRSHARLRLVRARARVDAFVLLKENNKKEEEKEKRSMCISVFKIKARKISRDTSF